MRVMRWWAMAAGALVLSAGAAAAQSAQPISLQVSGLYASLFGEDYEGIGNGFGGEAQLRFTPGALSIGAGGQFTRHGLETGFEGVDGNASFLGAFIEPRLVVAIGSNNFAPYVSTRFSFLRQSLDVSGDVDSCSGSNNGVTANAGGGILVRIGSRMNLDAGATYGYTRFGSGSFTCDSGEEGELSSGSGSNFVLRLGLAIGLGG
jgi:hypothetical protein